MAWFLKKRKSLRLKDYDYSQEGAYFFTIVVQNRLCLLGEILNRGLNQNVAGEMVARWWRELEVKFPSVQNDAFVVMPNHIHGILFLRQPESQGAHAGAPLQKIIQWFKTMTTNEYIHGVKFRGWQPFPGSLWQRNFFEHVVRDEDSLNRIREYIASNPKRWELDSENLGAKGKDEFDRWIATFKSRPPSPCHKGTQSEPTDPRHALGGTGEDLAAAFLKKQGYKILERNYRTPLGEIDLIGRHRGALVFIEVKTRRSSRFGSPQEAVHPAKQERYRNLASFYLQQHGLGEVTVRFDVVGILWQEGKPLIEVIEGAF